MELITEIKDSSTGKPVCSFSGLYDCKMGDIIHVKWLDLDKNMVREAEVVDIEPDFVNLVVRRITRTVRIYFKPVQ